MTDGLGRHLALGGDAATMPHWRHVVASVVRVIAVTLALVGLYATAPLDHPTHGDDVLRLILALLGYCIVVAFQISAVARSSFPGLRALEAVAVSVPLLIFMFASVYLLLGHEGQGNFNESLNHVDGVYFAMTVFSTVGFGDIAATSETARMVVTVQMVLDLFFLGVVARVLFGTVQRRREALTSGTLETVPEQPGHLARVQATDPSKEPDE